MARTAAQIAADDDLERAIMAVLEANDLIPNNHVLSSFVVLCASASMEGERSTHYAYVTPGEGSPWWHILGLVEVHRALFRQEMASDGD
jgi:hypothetical protein